jgi:site-specific recombinase XerD
MSRTHTELHSVLAIAIKAFLQYKRALGCKYQTETAALHLLDTYVADQRCMTWEQIDSSLIDAFLASRPRSHARSYNNLVAVAHRFFEWAVTQRMTDHNPVTTRPRRVTGQRIPYLFNLDEARRLLYVARSLESRSRAPMRGLVYETVFALLYGLGLRVGEVTRLLVGDVEFDRATLFVRDTKFNKSRLVPFGPQMGERLTRYVEQQFGGHGDPQAPLFSFTKRGTIHEGTISLAFHSLVPRLGLHIPAGVAHPRLHDLRHAFAVGTLLRWYQEGVDPNRRLIQLSTFLGHTDPASTSVYLTITEELLRQADLRFRAFAPRRGQS